MARHGSRSREEFRCAKLGAVTTRLARFPGPQASCECMFRETPTVARARDRLVNHPLSAELTDIEQVGIFMKHHAFAVWDFFNLLKRLQSEVTCVDVLWLPRGLGAHARFIIEMGLEKECGEAPRGGYTGHFELYLMAMDEVGADKTPIEGLLSVLEGSTGPIDPLENPAIPDTVRAFVNRTLRVALYGGPHEVAASFCRSHENLMIDVLGGGKDGSGDVLADLPAFKTYLQRHITLDHDAHESLALSLLEQTCERDPRLAAEAEQAGLEAIEARIGLWDGALAEIRGSVSANA